MLKAELKLAYNTNDNVASLIYKDEVLAVGKPADIKKELDGIFTHARKDEDIIRYLDELPTYGELVKIDDAVEKLGIKILVPKNLLDAVSSSKRMDKIYSKLRTMKYSKKFNPNKDRLVLENIDIPLSKNGISADFANTSYLYRTKGNERNIIRIKLTGNRLKDEKLAFELAGIKQTDEITINYVWHHMNDFNPSKGTCVMQLVERKVHRWAKPHYGSAALVDYFYQKAIYTKKLSLKI